MTLHEEVLALLRESDSIAAAIDAVEAAHGPHPEIEAARQWAARVRQDVLRHTRARAALGRRGDLRAALTSTKNRTGRAVRAWCRI